MAERGIIFKDDFISTPGKSWFDMSFDFLFSMNFGELVPSICMECMGGDQIHAKSDSFVRLAPLVAPTFGKANMFSYHFYVRNYSIWKSWRSFYSEGDQRESWQQAIGGSFVPPEVPYIKPMKVLDFIVANNSSPATDFIKDAHFDYTSGTRYLRTLHCNNVRLLVISAKDGGSVSIHNGVSGNDYCNFTYPYDSSTYDAESLFIAFIPNKYDTSDRTYFYNPQHFADSPSIYNVFSNGTLFDYLGVDLSGHYSKQYDIFKREVATIRTALSDSSPDLILSDDGFVRFGDFEFNLKEFLDRHKVVVYGYNHNQQLVSVQAHSGVYKLIGSMTHVSDIEALTPIENYDYESKISALPLRAYHSVYIDYFRDENYISVNQNVDFARDGEDIDFTLSKSVIFDYLTLNYKCYEHDPYTTALPQAQRGAPVRFINDSNLKVDQSGLTPSSYSEVRYANGQLVVTGNTSTSATYSSLVVDLSAATIENFRFANATQKLLEKIARSGNRYYEYMRAIYGVVVDDAKIDRPIFLGGDKSPIQISEVLQTSASEVTTDQPLGQMAGRGVSVGNDDYIEYIVPDPGFFVEICCALPRTNYQQGLAPMFHRFDRLDFAIPDYAQLGEQQVPQRELWYSANASDDETPFGFQSRFYDMKYQRDKTSGSFKDSLSYWTWTRIFDEAPIAGKEFLEVRPDYRQFAVTDKNAEHIYVHMWHDIQVNRALPVFGTPKL